MVVVSLRGLNCVFFNPLGYSDSICSNQGVLQGYTGKIAHISLTVLEWYLLGVKKA